MKRFSGCVVRINELPRTKTMPRRLRAYVPCGESVTVPFPTSETDKYLTIVERAVEEIAAKYTRTGQYPCHPEYAGDGVYLLVEDHNPEA